MRAGPSLGDVAGERHDVALVRSLAAINRAAGVLWFGVQANADELLAGLAPHEPVHRRAVVDGGGLELAGLDVGRELPTPFGVEVDHRAGAQHLLLAVLGARQVRADDRAHRRLVVLVVDECVREFAVSPQALPLVLGVPESLVGVRRVDRLIDARLKVVRRAVVVQERLLLRGGRHFFFFSSYPFFYSSECLRATFGTQTALGSVAGS